MIVTGLTLAASTFAQDRAKYESAALYSHLSSEPPTGQTAFHGYKWSLTVYLNERVGLGGDLIGAQDHNSDLLFGPEIRLLDRGRLGVRLHARVGAVDCRVLLDRARSVAVNVWSFATATGSFVDVDLGKGFSWRVVQPEVIWWRKRGQTRTDFRVSTGVVMRMGRTR